MVGEIMDKIFFDAETKGYYQFFATDLNSAKKYMKPEATYHTFWTKNLTKYYLIHKSHVNI